MKPADQVQPTTPYAATLQAFDRREIDCPNLRSGFRLKYLARLRAVIDAVRRGTPEDGIVVEVGCSQANISLLLAEQGYQTIAIDLLADALTYALARHERGAFSPVAADAAALPLRDASVDTLILAELLEHCPAPGEVVAEAIRALRPGGLLVVTTPNHAGRNARLPTYDRFAASPLDDALELGPHGDHHLFAFDPPSLSALLSACGLVRVRTALLGSPLMSDRLGPLKRLLPVSAIETLSATACALPLIGRSTAYTIIATARTPR